ncbi:MULTISPECIES: F0F1 ATP synthase subunit delta [Cohnella]|uniref:F0F1 ATP synthase subunit delta n=1 Tax=Cohnella TaxID=329857 RepID=UPI0009BA88A9|nr:MULTISPECIES: F0F1 ATP synthase subunit delta [Cohnella]MBN2980729.1 F0F1 ATP synthase subunit delta [Cohnella algarum]
MSGSAVAKRYAKALFDLSSEKGIVSETETELKAIVDALKQNADFRAFMTFPNIDTSKKIAAFKAIFGQAVSQAVLDTISLLIERDRQTELPAILDAYVKVAGEALGRAEAHVATPKPLTEGEKEQLAAKFGALLGKTVRVNETVDPTLLGGLTVRIGDTLYDGSLRGKLERLEKSLQTSAN